MNVFAPIIPLSCVADCGRMITPSRIWSRVCEDCYLLLIRLVAEEVLRPQQATAEAARDYARRWPHEQRQRAEAVVRLGGDTAALVAALGEPTS